MKKQLVAALLYCLTTPPAVAGGYVYDCDIPSNRDRPGWIPAKMGIVLGEDGSVTVLDPIILQFHEKPMQASVQRNDDRKLSIVWTLTNVENADKQKAAQFSYTAQVNKKNNRISVSARPEGYSNRFHGRGKCVIRTE
ncbi:hypothetical protein [uncultured Roseobacter sp.]|uniref:hypothetical protein n=1 Tax=uncultured Roseobacter sp. TaxID=114847 RepID=UPI002624DC33|nr:hypothetical protein [uncultured Roseobacter sp.]